MAGTSAGFQEREQTRSCDKKLKALLCHFSVFQGTHRNTLRY